MRSRFQNLRSSGDLCSSQLDRLAEARRVVAVRPVAQQTRRLQIIRRRGQRLVDLVRQCGGHLAHLADARDVREFRLQLLQPLARELALRDVAHETGEQPTAALRNLPNRQFHGERAAVPAPASDHAANADDATLAGGEVAPDILIVMFPMR